MSKSPPFFRHPPSTTASSPSVSSVFSRARPKEAPRAPFRGRSQDIRHRCHRPDHHHHDKGVDGPALAWPLGVQVLAPWPHGRARSQKVTMLVHTHLFRRGTVASSRVRSAGSLPVCLDFDSCRRGTTRKRRSWAADDGKFPAWSPLSGHYCAAQGFDCC